MRFRATVETPPGGMGAFICVPLDVRKVFGTGGRVPVIARLNGSAHRSSLMPMRAGGGPGAHFLVLNKKIRTAAGIELGDVVEVVLERDDKPRTIKPPADLVKRLKKAPAIWAAWQRLSYTHQREHVEAIEQAKKPETRQRRIERCLEMLRKPKKS